MKMVELRILFKSGARENYCIKDERLDYGAIKGNKDFIKKAIKEEATGSIEAINLETGFETVININEIAEIQFGIVQNC